MLPQVQGQVGATDKQLRAALLKFIADFSNWDLAQNRTYIEVERALTKAAHGDEPPVVVDPFAGGGSIPLEALRLGCDAFASDLNPVACLILKTLLEDIPRYGIQLAEDLRRIGREIKQQAEQELSKFYPPDAEGSKPIAYLWSRSVRCESPNCGAEIPLVRSYWLCKKESRKRALRHKVVRQVKAPPRIEFEIFEPKSDTDVLSGTVTRGKATCLACGAVLSLERVRAQLTAQRGGADVVFNKQGARVEGARLLAVVTLDREASGRRYRLPSEQDFRAVHNAQLAIDTLSSERLADGSTVVPSEPVIQARVARNSPFRFHLYGIESFGGLCTARQKLALLTFARLIRETKASDAVRNVLGLVLDRVASRGSSLSSWRYQADQEKVEHMFVRQALSLEWDFAEAVPLSASTGSFEDAVDIVSLCIDSLSGTFSFPGQAVQADATEVPLQDHAASVWFTDPPYYDAVPYSDLSDYFFIWLKRALPDHPLLRDKDEPSNPLTPKRNEIRMDEARSFNGTPKDGAFFESKIAAAFAEGRRLLPDEGVGCVVFAHKTTEGWEALLSGLISGGWTVTGSWPIATEMATRLRARKSAALATSVHLICRPRAEDAVVGDWAEVLRELPKRVDEWMQRLQAEQVRGADLVFACIGPALEIFSRYARVETADGRQVPLAEYLEKVWEVVGRTALRQILGTDSPGDFGEDARLTALFLWTLRATNGQNGDTAPSISEESTDESNDEEEDEERVRKPRPSKGYALPYDIVRRIAQPLGIHLERWADKLIAFEKGTVSLLPLSERAALLVEPGVANDLALIGPVRSAKEERQMSLFKDSAEIQRRATIATARGRVEHSTWSQLHLDSITTLDHVHKAMLLQKQGQTNALRELLFYEQHYRPDFVQLANALSALYPKESEEKRLLDAMLLAVPR